MLWVALAIVGTPLLGIALAGARLNATSDDPAQAERWAAFNSRAMVWSLVGCTVATIVLEMVGWVWPLWLVAHTAALYPARRRVLGERWSLGTYLGWQLSVLLVLLGTPALLAVLPLLADAARPWQWPVGLLIAALGVLWHERFPRDAIAVLRAQPLDRPELQERFASILAKAQCAPPRVFRAGRPGGSTVNALALPATREPGVVFFDTLLKQLTPAEIAAIFAHEVAHLEHYTPKLLRQMRWAAYGMLAVACTWAPMCRVFVGKPAPALIPLWTAAVLITFGLRAVRHQSHERDSDLRALELTGDGEALISALTKLHALLRMPRRLGMQGESMTTHPSLARRIQALRAAMGSASEPSAPSAPFAPVALRDAERAGSFMLIERDRVQWLSGVPDDTAPDPDALRAAARSFEAWPYGELAELRIVSSRARILLKQRTREGRTRSARLRPDEVARAQLALDHVDVQLGAFPSVRRAGSWLLITSALMLASAAVTVGAGLAVLYVALIGLVRPRPALIAAQAGTAVGVVLLAIVWRAPPNAGMLALVVLSALLILGLALYALRDVPAWRDLPVAEAPAGLWRLALPACALVLALALLAGGLLAFQVAVTVVPAGVVLACAACAALLPVRSPLARVVGALAGLLALLQLVAGTEWYRVQVAGEPLLATGPALATESWEPEIERVAIPEGAVSVRLSPQASAYALGISDQDVSIDEQAPPVRYSYTARGGAARTVVADDFQFMDEDRALVLVPQSHEGVELQLLSLADGATRTLLREVRLRAAQLSVEPLTGAWTLQGYGRRTDEVERVDGTLAEERDRVRLRLAQPGWPLPSAPSARGGVLQVRSDFEEPVLPWLFSLRWSLLGLYANAIHELRVVSVSRSTRLARTRATLSCQLNGDARDYMCSVSHGKRGELWTLDPRTRRLRALAQVGPLAQARWIARGHELVSFGSPLALLDLRARRRFVPVLRDDDTCVVDAAIGPRELALLNDCGGRGRELRFFEKPGPGGMR